MVKSIRVFFDSQGIVEPYKVMLRKGILMAKALVSAYQTSIPVSLINLTDQKVKVDRNLIIGNIHTVTSVSKVPESECLDVKLLSSLVIYNHC